MIAATDTVESAATQTAETVSKRVEANRRNAQHSTGPSTAEGKCRARRNSLKHGMTAKVIVLLDGEDGDLFHAKVAAWKDEFQPRSEFEDDLVERAVACAWQSDRIERAITAKLTELVRFGRLDRDEAEADEVEDQVRRLFWDPRGPIALYPHWRGFRVTPRVSGPNSLDDPINPARIVNRLENLAAGCRWLLDRWADLRGVLEQGLNWQAPDRLRAIRLLGRQPMDVLSDERVLTIYLACDAMDPTAATSLDDMMTETEDDELERIKERVRGRGADRKKPASPDAGKAALLALIEHVTTRLEVKLSRHRERQEFEKSMQMDLLAFDDSPEGELARRYQLAKDREMHRAINALLKVRKEARAAAEAEWPLADCIDGGVDAAPAGDEAAMGFGDETKPTPPGPVLVSRLEAADPVGIPAEAGTPAIQPPESGPRAEEVIGTGGETKPNPPSRPGDETKPNPPEPAAAIGAVPAIRKAGQPTPEEYMAGLVARLDPSHPQSAMAIETLRELERQSMS